MDNFLIITHLNSDGTKFVNIINPLQISTIREEELKMKNGQTVNTVKIWTQNSGGFNAIESMDEILPIDLYDIYVARKVRNKLMGGK